LCDRLRRME